MGLKLGDRVRIVNPGPNFSFLRHYVGREAIVIFLAGEVSTDSYGNDYQFHHHQVLILGPTHAGDDPGWPWPVTENDVEVIS